MVGAAGRGLVGAGGELGLCPCNSRCAFAAGAAPRKKKFPRNRTINLNSCVTTTPLHHLKQHFFNIYTNKNQYGQTYNFRHGTYSRPLMTAPFNALKAMWNKSSRKQHKKEMGGQDLPRRGGTRYVFLCHAWKRFFYINPFLPTLTKKFCDRCTYAFNLLVKCKIGSAKITYIPRTSDNSINIEVDCKPIASHKPSSFCLLRWRLG